VLSKKTKSKKALQGNYTQISHKSGERRGGKQKSESYGRGVRHYRRLQSPVSRGIPNLPRAGREKKKERRKAPGGIKGTEHERAGESGNPYIH